MLISVIIKTYNWPEALSLVLKSLNEQNTNFNFEVIIADDGSNNKTLDLINNLKNNLKNNLEYPIRQVWQEDLGFRSSKILNKALRLLKNTI
jgi:glycosyltransferase involved in cell wall biosynthesis